MSRGRGFTAIGPDAHTTALSQLSGLMAGELKAAFVPFTELKFPLESTPQGLALVREREATIRRIDQQHKHSTLPPRAQTASAASSRGDASARAIAAELRSARFGAYPDLDSLPSPRPLTPIGPDDPLDTHRALRLYHAELEQLEHAYTARRNEARRAMSASARREAKLIDCQDEKAALLQRLEVLETFERRHQAEKAAKTDKLARDDFRAWQKQLARHHHQENDTLRYGWRKLRRGDDRLISRATASVFELDGKRHAGTGHPKRHEHRRPIVKAYMMRTSDAI